MAHHLEEWDRHPRNRPHPLVPGEPSTSGIHPLPSVPSVTAWRSLCSDDGLSLTLASLPPAALLPGAPEAAF